eukprot:NODE_4037_length_716_cov_272.921331.p3 GENE.NODE_4037_length_716_cov_272.921331~~NODE_4037_length_716_cov_272.921331.p3  ORF type:complete len:85 (+),score=25.67 NODE_4037_length_716_cov_272.921331:211-465(+)
MNALAEAHGDKVTFILINTRGRADAETYKSSKGLNSEKLKHGGNRPPDPYGLRYIPHKCVIGSDGKVIKNFDGVNLKDDIAAWI